MAYLLVFFMITGTTGKIQGVVKDADSGEPVPDANIVITGTGIGAAADEKGCFAILNLIPGSYDVEVSCIGYETKLIKKVMVQVDKTARLSVSLQPALIEMPPVSVIYKQKDVEKDWTGTTYIIRNEEIRVLPIDYTTGLIQFQPSVALMDTSLHVRGGRPTEVAYLIDNVSIIDPLTGEPAINLSKSMVDEIIFLPGGFDAEYGRAMSGVVNVITQNPAGKLQAEASGKSERVMPMYYDFGYENAQGVIHLPSFLRSKALVSLDMMHTDDWQPKLVLLPHKQRDDYALYGKWVMAPSGKLRMSLSGAQSHSQFDRYHSYHWRMHLERYRSDLKKGNLQAFNLNYLPDSRELFNLTLSRLYSRYVYGVRIYKDYGLFEDFEFKDYRDIEFFFGSGSINNPFGVRRAYIPYDSDFPEYRDRTSQVYEANASTVLDIHEYHEIKAGLDYSYNIFDNFTYWDSNDTLDPIVDAWNYRPDEFSVYLQDNIDYQGLYAKVGCRYDYFSSKIPGVSPKSVISPRLGVSLLVTEKFLFHANFGKYTQPPLYDYMYRYYLQLPYPEWVWYNMTVIGNPDLGPEKTTSYEVGCQGAFRENMNITCNAFYKDITGLTGTRVIVNEAHTYWSYFNVEYGSAKGIETILDYSSPIFTGKISYTLSWAKGTSSYATEVHEDYWQDTTYIPSADEYDLDFDQRHRFLAQGTFNLPMAVKLHLFGYVGFGFPYAEPNTENKVANAPRSELQKQVDCIVTAPVKISRFTVSALAEVINILDIRYEKTPYGSIYIYTPPRADELNDYMTLDAPYYHPAVDYNHDGVITPREEYTAHQDMWRFYKQQAWISVNSAPRRARVGISIVF
jgi:outer membrane receptor protein involved in Fe transport